jgi:hypothetical protein
MSVVGDDYDLSLDSVFTVSHISTVFALNLIMSAFQGTTRTPTARAYYRGIFS